MVWGLDARRLNGPTCVTPEGHTRGLLKLKLYWAGAQKAKRKMTTNSQPVRFFMASPVLIRRLPEEAPSCWRAPCILHRFTCHYAICKDARDTKEPSQPLERGKTSCLERVRCVWFSLF